MDRNKRIVLLGIALCALACILAQSASAGTIIKLSLGGDSAADVEYSGGAAGVLSTVNDGIAATTGEQNTAVEFLDFLDSLAADILTSTASFTMNGLTADGAATVLGGLFMYQEFTGGTLELYDAANVLLISGSLVESALAGPLGAPATGGVFTTSFGTFTGGTLAPYIDPGSLSLSMSLISINGSAGLAVTPPVPVNPPPLHTGTLNAFTADASVIIDGEIPEPASTALAAIATALAVTAAPRRRRRSKL